MWPPLLRVWWYLPYVHKLLKHYLLLPAGNDVLILPRSSLAQKKREKGTIFECKRASRPTGALQALAHRLLVVCQVATSDLCMFVDISYTQSSWL